MKTLFLFLALFFLFGCTNPNLIKYEYKDKDGNIHVEYIDKNVLNDYNNNKK